jgi:hypothetical protein
MNAAALGARVKRLTALIDGLAKETEAVRADRGRGKAGRTQPGSAAVGNGVGAGAGGAG